MEGEEGMSDEPAVLLVVLIISMTGGAFVVIGWLLVQFARLWVAVSDYLLGDPHEEYKKGN